MKTRYIGLIISLVFIACLLCACEPLSDGSDNNSDDLELSVLSTEIRAFHFSNNKENIYVLQPVKTRDDVVISTGLIDVYDESLNLIKQIQCETHNNKYYIKFYAAAWDGGVWAIEETTNSVNEPEKSLLNYYDSEGKIQMTVCPPVDFGMRLFYILHANDDGVYICYGDVFYLLSNVALIDKEGNLVAKWEGMFNNSLQIKTLDDGRTILMDIFSGGRISRIFRLNNDGTAEQIHKIDSPYNLIAAGIGNNVYITIGPLLSKLSLDTSEINRVADWSDMSIMGMNLGLDGLAVFPEDKLIGLLSSGWITIFEKAEDKIIEEDTRQVIRVAIFGGDPLISNAVIDFNANNETHRMEIVNYAEYNTPSDPFGGTLQLNLDMVSGRCPDLFFWGMMARSGSFNPAYYTGKGVFADMYGFLDDDGTYNRDILVPNAIKAVESSDGRLYELPIEFVVNAVACGRDDITLDNWTFKEFFQEINKHENADMVFGWGSVSNALLYTILSNNWDEYIDWQTRTCNFMSESFIMLLEFLDKQRRDPWDFIFPHEAIAEGRQLLVFEGMNNVSSIQKFKAMFQGEIHFIGFPSSQGRGNAMVITRSISIAERSQHKDICWEFIRQYYSRDYQLESLNFYPTNAEAMEERLTHPEKYEESGVGITYTAPFSPDGESFTVMFTDATEEESAQVRELIYSLDRVSRINDILYNIISEETDAFFAGDKTAEDTARIIQNKVQIYLGE